MEKILVGIDFSESSINAAHYAVKLASYFSAQVVLFNAFTIPMPYPEAGVVFSVDEYEKEAADSLIKIKETLHEKVPQIDITILTKLGEGETSIDEELSTGKYDLLVLGIDNIVSSLYEYFIGSTSTAIARDSKVPTLIIPNYTLFHKIKKIAYACDYNNDFKKSNVLIYLKYFAKAFGAELLLFNIVNSDTQFTIDVINHELHVQDSLEKINPSIIYSSNKDVAQGIIQLGKEHAIDMLITSPTQHHFFYEWYHQSNTKKLAFHSNLPLLCLAIR